MMDERSLCDVLFLYTFCSFTQGTLDPMIDGVKLCCFFLRRRLHPPPPSRVYVPHMQKKSLIFMWEQVYRFRRLLAHWKLITIYL